MWAQGVDARRGDHLHAPVGRDRVGDFVPEVKAFAGGFQIVEDGHRRAGAVYRPVGGLVPLKR